MYECCLLRHNYGLLEYLMATWVLTSNNIGIWVIILHCATVNLWSVTFQVEVIVFGWFMEIQKGI